MLPKILLLISGILLLGCNPQSSSDVATTPSGVSKSSSQSVTTTEISGIYPHKGKSAKLKNLHGEVINGTNQLVFSQPMKCTIHKIYFSCDKISLPTKPSGFYRFNLYQQGTGLIGSATLEISEDFTPNSLTIDEDTTGTYLITVLSKYSQLNEEQLYDRVRHILTQNSSQEYDLGTTLYNLFMVYGGDRNESNAIASIGDLIKSGKKIPRKVKTQMRLLAPLY